MPKQTRNQLLNMVPSYRAGWVSGGAKDEDITDQDVVKKMEEADVQHEAQAEKLGREQGFEDRKKK